MISFDDRALVQARRAFARYLAAIDSNWAAADVDALHDLRVAIRRTRALLANAKGVLPEGERTRFAAAFRDLAHATTAARDLDVAVADWPQITALVRPSIAARLEPVHDALCRRRDAARAAVATTLESAATHAVVQEWRTWLAATPAFETRRAAQPAKRMARRRAHKIRRRLERLARVDSPAARHEWRKQAKRLRYLAEAFPAVGRGKLVRRLTDAQDELGRGRDRLVQAGIVEAIASEPVMTDDVKAAAAALADVLRQQSVTTDPRRKVSRSLKRWIHAA